MLFMKNSDLATVHGQQVRRNRRTGKVIFLASCLFVVIVLIESIYAQNPVALIRYLILLPIILAIPTFIPKCPLRVQGITAMILWLGFVPVYG